VLTIDRLWHTLDRQVNVNHNTLATIAKDHKLFLGRRTQFRIEKLSLKRLIELLVLVKNLLQSLDGSSSDLQGVDRILHDDELGLDLDLDPDVFAANLEHLLLCLRHQLIGLLIGNPIDLGRRHVSECQRDQKRRCLDWFFEYPDARHPESTTWPWSLKPSLAVLWGVCWMFHGPDGLDTPPRFDAEGNLVDEQGGVLVPRFILEYAQQLRQTSSYPPGTYDRAHRHIRCRRLLTGFAGARIACLVRETQTKLIVCCRRLPESRRRRASAASANHDVAARTSTGIADTATSGRKFARQHIDVAFKFAPPSPPPRRRESLYSRHVSLFMLLLPDVPLTNAFFQVHLTTL